MIFFALLRPMAGKLSLATRLVLSLLLESVWEVAENSDAVIERYHRATIALGYTGDHDPPARGRRLRAIIGGGVMGGCR